MLDGPLRHAAVSNAVTGLDAAQSTGTTGDTGVDDHRAARPARARPMMNRICDRSISHSDTSDPRPTSTGSRKLNQESGDLSIATISNGPEGQGTTASAQSSFASRTGRTGVSRLALTVLRARY